MCEKTCPILTHRASNPLPSQLTFLGSGCRGVGMAAHGGWPSISDVLGLAVAAMLDGLRAVQAVMAAKPRATISSNYFFTESGGDLVLSSFRQGIINTSF